MTITGNERFLTRCLLGANLVFLALLFIGVPIFGAVFRAVALAVGTIGWNIGAAVWTILSLGINSTILIIFNKTRATS